MSAPDLVGLVVAGALLVYLFVGLIGAGRPGKGR